MTLRDIADDLDQATARVGKVTAVGLELTHRLNAVIKAGKLVVRRHDCGEFVRDPHNSIEIEVLRKAIEDAEEGSNGD